MCVALSVTRSVCHTCQVTDHFKRRASQLSRIRPVGPVKAFWPFSQANKAASAASAKQAKSKLAQLAGKKYGHDLSESQKQDVREVLKELEALDSREIRQKELAGSNWKLLYTESTGSSGGKVGPLVGQVDQAIESRRFMRCGGTHTEHHSCSCMHYRSSQRTSQGST